MRNRFCSIYKLSLAKVSTIKVIKMNIYNLVLILIISSFPVHANPLPNFFGAGVMCAGYKGKMKANNCLDIILNISEYKNNHNKIKINVIANGERTELVYISIKDHETNTLLLHDYSRVIRYLNRCHSNKECPKLSELKYNIEAATCADIMFAGNFVISAKFNDGLLSESLPSPKTSSSTPLEFGGTAVAICASNEKILMVLQSDLDEQYNIIKLIYAKNNME